MKVVEREVRGEIMGTDVFVKIVSSTKSESDLNRDLDHAFAMLRDIGRRFSRFQDDSELCLLNAASEIKVSPEMTEILSFALASYAETEGVFDPSILSALETQGYAESFGSASFGVPSGTSQEKRYPFDTLTVDFETGIVRKPIGLRIDLGGIAKGYSVDRVVRMLRERGNADFLIDAGGDIFASGGDAEHGYGYWAIDIADSSGKSERAALLILSDQAVATSGTDRRRWSVGNEMRHHLIDPKTGRSAETDILSVTVVGNSVVRAEVFAKTLCVIGRERAIDLAEKRGIPAFLVTETGETVYTTFMKPYIYDEKN